MFLFGGGAAPPYPVPYSCRLRAAGSTYLQLILTTNTTTSGSIWTKHGTLGAIQPVFDNKIYFNSSNQLVAFGLTSTALYRDPSAWYQLFWNGSGVWLGVNGGSLVQVTGTGTYTPASVINPRLGYDGTNYYDGYFANFAFWDAASVSLTGGKTDPGNPNNWIANPPASGMTSYLQFGNSAALGTDTSGNGNNWTVTNLASTDQMTDTPTNNYCTLNPLDKDPGLATSYITQGNLSVGGDTTRGIRSTLAVSSGKWYWETKATALVGNSSEAGIRLVNSAWSSGNAVGFYPDGYVYMAANGNKQNNNISSAFGSGLITNDILGHALDMDTGTYQIYKNGTLIGTMFSGLSGTYSPAVNAAASETWLLNFGQTSFAYTPPTGFKSLCTSNLPAAASAASVTPLTGSFAGNASTDGPDVWLGYTPGTGGASTINGNTVTWGTDAYATAGGLKIITNSASYNASGSNTYSIAVEVPFGGSNVSPACAQ